MDVFDEIGMEEDGLYRYEMDKNYILVEFDEMQRDDLVKDVNALIGRGYIPLGGISVRAGSSSGAYLMQAMIKASIINE